MLRTKGLVAWVVLAVAGAGICRGQAPLPVTTRTVTVGIVAAADTTVFTQPLRSDGTVDLFAALNAREGAGVTAANNAAVLLARITGEMSSQRRMAWDRAVRAMGVDPASLEPVEWRSAQELEGTERRTEDAYRHGQERPLKAEELPGLEAWLGVNAQVLGLAVEASQRSRYWWPLLDTESDGHGKTRGTVIQTPAGAAILTWREVMESLRLRAMLKLGRGDSTGAWADLAAVHRLARLWGESSDILNVLSGTMHQYAACDADRALLINGKVDASKMLADLKAIGFIPNLRPTVGLWARCGFIDALQLIASEQGKEWLRRLPPADVKRAQEALAGAGVVSIDWNCALRFGNRFYDEWLKDDSSLPADQRTAHQAAVKTTLGKYDAVFEEADIYKMQKETVPGAWLLPRAGETRVTYSERIATVVLVLTLPSLDRSELNVTRANERLAWTIAATAVVAYRQDTGAPPAGLDRLTGKYLDRLPIGLQYERTAKGCRLSATANDGQHWIAELPN